MTRNRNIDEIGESVKFDALMEIMESTNEYNKNKNGYLINVTQNMIYLKDQNTDKIIRIAKKEIIAYRSEDYIENRQLPGKRLLGRPEEVIA